MTGLCCTPTSQSLTEAKGSASPLEGPISCKIATLLHNNRHRSAVDVDDWRAAFGVPELVIGLTRQGFQ